MLFDNDFQADIADRLMITQNKLPTMKLLIDLGLALQEIIQNDLRPVFDDTKEPGITINRFCERCSSASARNSWFTPENVRLAVTSWAETLTPDNVTYWLRPYQDKIAKNRTVRTVGIVMAGNIPLVGLHDLLCALVAGHKVVARLSSDDTELITGIVELINALEHDSHYDITLTDQRLKGFDAILATGSNNTSRYFEYYFGKYPNIIRKNRNSIAVLDGDETQEELAELGKDIFSYFGLGCRNVSKIFFPEKYDVQILFNALGSFRPVIHHHKYCNNYDYQKSILMINKIPFFDNGFLVLKESASLISPVSVLHYSCYSQIEEVIREINALQDQIQCIVSQDKRISQAIPLGMAQTPALWDYADGVDTLDFLLSL